MVSAEATLSTYTAIKARTEWTASSVKLAHRSEGYMVCVMVFDGHCKMNIIGPASPCWHKTGFPKRCTQMKLYGKGKHFCL